MCNHSQKWQRNKIFRREKNKREIYGYVWIVGREINIWKITSRLNIRNCEKKITEEINVHQAKCFRMLFVVLVFNKQKKQYRCDWINVKSTHPWFVGCVCARVYMEMYESFIWNWCWMVLCVCVPLSSCLLLIVVWLRLWLIWWLLLTGIAASVCIVLLCCSIVILSSRRCCTRIVLRILIIVAGHRLLSSWIVGHCTRRACILSANIRWWLTGSLEQMHKLCKLF